MTTQPDPARTTITPEITAAEAMQELDDALALSDGLLAWLRGAELARRVIRALAASEARLAEVEREAAIAWDTVQQDADLRAREQQVQRLRAQPQRPIVVCLCGSTRFMDAFHEANRRLTLEGKIVLTVAVVKSDVDDGFINQVTPEQAAMLDTLHLRKIDLADELLVLNVGQYIGASTQQEIAYAQAVGKPIRYWETCSAARSAGEEDSE